MMPQTASKLRSIKSSLTTRRAKADGSREKVRLLKLIVMKLQEELESISEVASLDVESGINFYEEVRHFEIELISRALTVMGGQQSNAARLLNMNATTLNAKMKCYNIRIGQHVSPVAKESKPP